MGVMGLCCVVVVRPDADAFAARQAAGDMPPFMPPHRGLPLTPPVPFEWLEVGGAFGVNDRVRATGPPPMLQPGPGREDLARDTGTSLWPSSCRWPFCGEAGIDRTPGGEAVALDGRERAWKLRETGGDAPRAYGSTLRCVPSLSSDVADDNVVLDI